MVVASTNDTVIWNMEHANWSVSWMSRASYAGKSTPAAAELRGAMRDHMWKLYKAKVLSNLYSVRSSLVRMCLEHSTICFYGEGICWCQNIMDFHLIDFVFKCILWVLFHYCIGMKKYEINLKSIQTVQMLTGLPAGKLLLVEWGEETYTAKQAEYVWRAIEISCFSKVPQTNANYTSQKHQKVAHIKTACSRNKGPIQALVKEHK